MLHIFRKYLSNRGSALFMVISTMTALLISSMAMYFTLVTSHSAQYAVFNKMQSAQSAKSIADIVYKSIAGSANHGNGGGVLLAKMVDLNVGESISTDANGFKSLDPNSGLTGKDVSDLGAYSVTITRLPNGPNSLGKNVWWYDICVISSVDGNKDAVHMKIEYDEDTQTGGNGEGNTGGGSSKLFAATGYIPNDAYIDGGYYLTDVFYDTQYTYMNAFDSGSGENRIGYNLYTGGDLEIGSNAMTVVKSATGGAISPTDVSKIGPLTWAIRGNFTTTLADVFDFRGGSNIYVGGDFVVKNGGFINRNDSNYSGDKDIANAAIRIYVNGDFVVDGNNWLNLDNKNIKMFINGSLKKATNGGGINGMNSNGITFYMTDTSKADSYFQNVHEWNVPTPADKEAFNIDQDPASAWEHLGLHTVTVNYYKWDLSANTNEADSAQHITIDLNASGGSADGLDKWQCTYFLSYDENTESAKEHLNASHTGTAENGAIGKSFIIDDIKIHGGESYIPRTIVIDTGDDDENIITIKLKPNYDSTKFMWFPEGGANVTVGRNVILKGRGTVLFDIPSGTTYQDIEGQFIMHYGWWNILGGRVREENGHVVYDSGSLYNNTSASSQMVPYIHNDCTDGDGCTYTTKPSTKKCANNHNMVTASCSVHGDVETYCPTCQPDKAAKTSGWCTYHVNKTKVDEYYNAISDPNEKERWKGTDGDIVYPTTNIFLVSCDESADMRFAKAANGTEISKNALFGFVYAPYMTYRAAGGNNTGFVKLCGGLIVGDYDIKGTNSYLGLYPEKMPDVLSGLTGGGDMSGGPISSSTRTWKISIGGYR